MEKLLRWAAIGCVHRSYISANKTSHKKYFEIHYKYYAKFKFCLTKNTSTTTRKIVYCGWWIQLVNKVENKLPDK